MEEVRKLSSISESSSVQLEEPQITQVDILRICSKKHSTEKCLVFCLNDYSFIMIVKKS